MSWFYLILAGVFEIGWTIGLKLMDNHKNLPWTIVFYLSLAASFGLLQIALKSIPIGTAYAIYTSIGAVGAVLVGMIFFKEPFTAIRLGFLFLVIVGIIGLKITSSPQP